MREAFYAIIYITVMSGYESGSLRKRVLKGSMYLTLRNGVSMLLGLIGSLLVTKLIGPENYGLYMAAFGIFNYLIQVGSIGIMAYLIREQSTDFIKKFHLAFWWLLGLGLCTAVIASSISFAMGQAAGHQHDFPRIAASLFLMMPIGLTSAVPQALLERNLDYRMQAIVQVSSQLGLYLVAVPLAWLGFGAWALVSGFWLSQIVQLAGYYVAARYRPRWYWSRADWKQMMHYSVSQSLSVWLYNLRDLAPSLILFPLAGERAMGYYSLANRLVSVLGFLYSASGRIAFAAFARLQQDKERLAKAIQSAIQYLVVFLGLVMSVFGACVDLIASWILGQRWDAFVIQQLCIVIASRVLISSPFGVQTQALYVIGQNWLKVKANAAFAGVLMVAGWLLVSTAPVAYAPLMFVLADHIAHIPTYWYDMTGVRKHIGYIDYRAILLWLMAAQAALFAPLVGYWLYIVTAGLLLHPLSLTTFRELYSSLKSTWT